MVRLFVGRIVPPRSRRILRRLDSEFPSLRARAPDREVGGSVGHAVKSPLIGTGWGDFLPWRAAYWLGE
jgi:hypothetical protein